MGLNSGSPTFYDSGINPNRSASHSVPCYGTSFAYPSRDETPNPTYYANSYVPQSSDFQTYNQPPFTPSRMNPHAMANGGHTASRQYAGNGMPGFPPQGYPVRPNDQNYALRAEMAGHPYGEGMVLGRRGGSREPELFSDDASNKTRYECTYCGKGFSRPSALKVSGPAVPSSMPPLMDFGRFTLYPIQEIKVRAEQT